MYISKIKIQNYRNFGEPAFELLLKPFTLVIGENNTGKTNLLNAIGLIFSQDIMVFRRRVLEIDDFNFETIKKFKKQVFDLTIDSDKIEFPSVLVEVTLLDFNEAQQAVVGDWLTNQELTEAKITYIFSLRGDWMNKKKWIDEQRKRVNSKVAELKKVGINITEEIILSIIDFPIDNYEYLLYGGNDASSRCDPHLLKMLKMEFLDALRDAKKELIASGDFRLLYKILNKKDHEGYSSIKAVLETLEDEIKRNKNLLEIKKEVSELLQKVSLQEKETDNTIDFSFTSPETAEMLKKIGLTYGSNPISVERNGLGRNNLLYISIILSQLSGTHSNGDYTYFRVVGIEEPEAHLHPTLQSHLAQNIEDISQGKQELQLLITSHSTHITAKLDLANTVILYREESTNNIKHHYVLQGINPTTEAESINFLGKYLDATKSTMFFSKRLILVEGISEQLLIPELFQIHSKGNSIGKLNCAVLNVNGVAFRNFLKIISNGFFIKCLVLTDSDAGTKTEDRAENLITDFASFPTISVQKTSTSTFEKDILEVNKKGKGKEILLNALVKTRPINGKTYKESLGIGDINVDTFFSEIVTYKSEFAFNLLDELKKDSKDFLIPKYISDGFEFLLKNG